MTDKRIILPNNEEIDINGLDKTTRAKNREKEDVEYLPVIIKRNDDTIRHPDDILEKVIHEGIEQHKRSNLSLFFSALAAGLILGFAAMCVALASQLIPDTTPLMQRLIMALFYPLGFIVCIMSGTQLFTEQTATAVYPVLDKKVAFASLFRLWLIVLAGNFVGTLISSGLISMADSIILAREGFLFIADHLIHYSSTQIFVSALLAGWLMAQGGWLIMATPPASTQILCIYIVTFIIGIGGLHHSIAGSAEIFGAYFMSKNPDIFNMIRFLVMAVFGNLIGGSFFVAMLNYAHIKKTQ